VSLVVNDGTSSSAPATTTATISNRPPVADAGPDRFVELGASATLDGTGSSDPDGDALGYVWTDQGGVTVGTGPTVSLTLPLGEHVFTLTVDDGHEGSASDIMKVTVSDTTAPAVTVLAPENVAIQAGIPVQIEWTGDDIGGIESFDVSFSTNGGSSFSPVPGCTALPGASRSCVWPSPGPATEQGRMRVIARDASGNAGLDDSVFAIVDPTITVTAPNTLVGWAISSNQTITWTSNLGPAMSVHIEISRNGGSSWSTIIPVAPNTGSFAWTVTGSPTSNARVRVSWTANPAVNDRSDVSFTISAPFVTITAPNTAVTWMIGTTRTITWNHNLGTSAFMKLELSRDGGNTWTVINAAVPNNAGGTGTYNWLVTGPFTPRARVRVSWTSNLTVNDRSNTNFTIR
jgi:K319-like protein